MRQTELRRDAITAMLIFYEGNGGIAGGTMQNTPIPPEARYKWMLACYKRTQNGSIIVAIDGVSVRITAVRDMRIFRHAGSFKTVTNKGLKERFDGVAKQLGYGLGGVGRQERADKQHFGSIPDDDYKTLSNKELASKYGVSVRKIANMKKEWKQALSGDI